MTLHLHSRCEILYAGHAINAYLCMKINVSIVYQSNRDCSSRPCNDCILKGAKANSQCLISVDGNVLHHLLRHCWPFRLCPIRAATSVQDIPVAIPPFSEIIDVTIVVSSWTSWGDQAPMKCTHQYRQLKQHQGADSTSPSLGAMDKVVSVAVTAVSRRSPNPF